jgi:hypothetical protein
MTNRVWLGAAALLLVCCDGGSSGGGPSAPSAQDRVTQNFDYTLRLTPSAWAISGPEFTSRNGATDVVARIDSPLPITYQIDLLYIGGAVPHNEGSGGVSAQGPGPILSAQWNVGFSGQFRARIYPASQPPLPVPPEGINIPVTFTITHP